MTIETKFNPGDIVFALTTNDDGKVHIHKISIASIRIDEDGLCYNDPSYRSYREVNLYSSPKEVADSLIADFYEPQIIFDNENPEEL